MISGATVKLIKMIDYSLIIESPTKNPTLTMMLTALPKETTSPLKCSWKSKQFIHPQWTDWNTNRSKNHLHLDPTTWRFVKQIQNHFMLSVPKATGQVNDRICAGFGSGTRSTTKSDRPNYFFCDRQPPPWSHTVKKDVVWRLLRVIKWL